MTFVRESLTAAFIVCAFSPSVVGQRPAESVQVGELSKLAKKLVEKQAVELWPGTVEVYQTHLSYDFPSIDKWSPGESAHQTAMAHELVILSLQKMNRPAAERPVWDKTFAEVRGRIQRILDLAVRRGDTVPLDFAAGRRSWLQEENDAIEMIYANRMQELARNYGVKVINEMKVESFIVHLDCQPRNGTIRLIRAGDWELYQLRRRKNPDAIKPAWLVTHQGGVSLFGQNYVHVTWPNGTSFGPELVRFQVNTSLRFTPNGPEQIHSER